MNILEYVNLFDFVTLGLIMLILLPIVEKVIKPMIGEKNFKWIPLIDIALGILFTWLVILAFNRPLANFWMIIYYGFIVGFIAMGVYSLGKNTIEIVKKE